MVVPSEYPHKKESREYEGIYVYQLFERSLMLKNLKIISKIKNFLSPEIPCYYTCKDKKAKDCYNKGPQCWKGELRYLLEVFEIKRELMKQK